MLSKTAQFYLGTAFTTSPFKGNPAAVLFLDTLESISIETLGEYAKNFNQPMLSVVSPSSLPSDRKKTLLRSVRFFAPNGKPVPICGHGLLVASKLVFSLPEAVACGIDTIRFENGHGQILSAFKHDDGSVAIEIPATIPGIVSDEHKERIKEAVYKSFGREVKIDDIVNGGEVYGQYVLVKLHENEDLAGSSVNAKELISTGFSVNVFTTKSPTSDQLFVSRMFSPSMLPEPYEDHVCGSAHGVLAPYWSSKLPIKPGEQFKAKMVSHRSGDLNLTYMKAEGILKLSGDVTIFASGTVPLATL
ncbi:Phenazine biosynthesis-like domain-containing protein [Psilocybe cubensis]|uniref:Phenazine biosynthesis-like domain-containing protein n=2 Tax=Psilocybe cubensis TaxID=181762 RepID=A0ACB8HGX2_PSICU|nr:Phenazine biosynthesis-like domain-containing protein [Psilocybe cubensis]KAH9486380.1 Phenazine biosynthesis-like domain-containing protein [Psilocybe cubensis]